MSTKEGAAMPRPEKKIVKRTMAKQHRYKWKVPKVKNARRRNAHFQGESGRESFPE